MLSSVLGGKISLQIINNRAAIVSSIKYVDQVVPQTRYDIEGKIETVKKYHIDVMFVGSNWQGTDKWNRTEEELSKYGCKVIYLPHTDGISSTLLREKINRFHIFIIMMV